MDHQVASNTHAVERYLLGEMPSEERDAFEEHYFTCAQCAEDLQAASRLVRDMKGALGEIEPARKRSSPGWLSWLQPQVLIPARTALVLAVFVGYQNAVVLPDLKAPRSMASTLILDGRTRGGLPTLSREAPLHFETMVEGATADRVFVELTSQSGARVRGGEVAAPAPNRPLDVYFLGALAA